MTNLDTMLVAANTYGGNISTIFWSIFTVCAGIAVGTLVWRKFKKGTNA